MKLVTFSCNGKPSYGVATDDGIFNVGEILSDRYADLKSIILSEAYDKVLTACDSLREPLPYSAVEVMAVIPNPCKIFCIGVNYEAHRKETGRPKLDHPTVFIRFADTLIGHGQPILKPKVSDCIDWEGELAVIIGKAGRAIPESNAMAHVAGYSCFNDVSIRDWQRHTSQFSPGKNFPTTGPLGPWLVTANDIPNAHDLELSTNLNGQEMQRTSTDDLIFGIPTLISYISTFTPLMPGDIIATGTPGGVGSARKPPLFMKNGDTVEVTISDIGTLTNQVLYE